VFAGLIARIGVMFAGSAIKWWLIGGGILSALGMITYLYVSLTSMAKENGLLTAKVAEQAQVIDEKEQVIQRQQALMKLQAAFSKQLDADVQKIDDNSQSVQSWINSAAARKSDRPSSLILQKTIEKLGVSK
jgi:hypothetical protein